MLAMGTRRSTYPLFCKVRDGALHIEISGQRKSFPLLDRVSQVHASVVYIEAVAFATTASAGTLTAGQCGAIGGELSTNGYYGRSP